MMRRMCVLCAVGLLTYTSTFAQALRTASLPADYRVQLDVPYITDGAWVGKLDTYARKSAGRSPVVIWWHGGNGTKEEQVFRILPLFEMGLSVVIPQGRDSPSMRIPASTDLLLSRIEAGRCALRWVTNHAEEQGFDANKLVLAGTSLGGYTVLMTGLVTSRDGFDSKCPGSEEPKVHAIVNFFGLIRLAQERVWKDPSADTSPVHPLRYVRTAGPPILTIHGDADALVPYSEGVELNTALALAGARHDFLRVAGGGHGLANFSAEQLDTSWRKIREFLGQCGLW